MYITYYQTVSHIDTHIADMRELQNEAEQNHNGLRLLIENITAHQYIRNYLQL